VSQVKIQMAQENQNISSKDGQINAQRMRQNMGLL
jgi:hypothetical protein